MKFRVHLHVQKLWRAGEKLSETQWALIKFLQRARSDNHLRATFGFGSYKRAITEHDKVTSVQIRSVVRKTYSREFYRICPSVANNWISLDIKIARKALSGWTIKFLERYAAVIKRIRVWRYLTRLVPRTDQIWRFFQTTFYFSHSCSTLCW